MSSSEKFVSRIEIRSSSRLNLIELANAIKHFGTISQLSSDKVWDYECDDE